MARTSRLPKESARGLDALQTLARFPVRASVLEAGGLLTARPAPKGRDSLLSLKYRVAIDPKDAMPGQRVLLPVSSPFNRRPATQRPFTFIVSSSYPSDAARSGEFAVKVTLIGRRKPILTGA